jgi:hypothetical protein
MSLSIHTWYVCVHVLGSRKEDEGQGAGISSRSDLNFWKLGMKTAIGITVLISGGRARSRVCLFEEAWSDTCICQLRRSTLHCWRMQLGEVCLMDNHFELDIC